MAGTDPVPAHDSSQRAGHRPGPYYCRGPAGAPRQPAGRTNAERALNEERYHDSGYEVTSLNGGPMAPDRLSRCFRQLSAAVGLPPIRLHDLRHGAASLAQTGADLKVARDMLGHASIVLTADTCTSVLPEVARKAAEDTAALIISAGCLIPGTQRRRPEWRSLRRRAHAMLTGGLSPAHPARQIARQCR